ncbi:MAG: hypothetical protein WC593_04040 [Methanoregula sp.]
MIYETQFLFALVLTWLVEVPVLWFLIRTIVKLRDVPVIRIIFTGILATALTLPYLWFVLPAYIGATHYLLIGELFVIAVESVILNQILRIRPGLSIALSAVMNAASFIVGWWVLGG